MKNKSYKHWIIVLLMCCLSASSIGLCTNAVGVFYTPVSMSLNVLRGTFALHATLSTLSTAITSLYMPYIMKRYSYKRVLIIGVLLASVSTFLMAYSHTMILFYMLGIIRGIGVGTYSMVPLTMIISQWFDEKHGLATSIALSFSGLSGAIFSPLLSLWISQYGWQNAYIFMAICIVVLTIPAILYPWTLKPEDSQLLPYGLKDKTQQILKTEKSNFHIFTLSFVSMCILTVLHTSITGISQHLSGLATSLGFTSAIGATLMSLTMIGNISTKLIIGFLSDLLNPIKACVIMILINIISLLLLIVGMNTLQLPILLIASFIFGSIYSVGAVGIPLLTRYFFGIENYSMAYSKVGFLTNVGSSLSLTLIGYLYDFTLTYHFVIDIAILFHCINLCLLILLTYRYKRGIR